MAIYRKGQASMDAQGYITGYNTKWRETLSLIRPGATIFFLGAQIKVAQITEVISDTSMRAISTDGTAVAQGNYIILLHDAITVDGLAQDVAETLRYYQGKESEIANFIEFLRDFDFKKLEDLTNQTKESAAAAKVSETNAKTSENAAKASQTAAKTSETNAKNSENAANTSKNAAATSATNAKNSENAALASKNAAAASQTAAKTSETNAKASETAAKNSQTAALNSQNAAKTSETNAKASETAAASSKDAAATSATNAKASETAANNSKNAAATSATNAATSASKAEAAAASIPAAIPGKASAGSGSSQWIKAANLRDASNSAGIYQYIIAGSGSYGQNGTMIEFLSISTRALSSMTDANVANWINHVSINGRGANGSKLRIGVVKLANGSWDLYFNAPGGWWTNFAVNKLVGVGNFITGPLEGDGFANSAWSTTAPAGVVMVERREITDTKNYGTAVGDAMRVGEFGIGRGAVHKDDAYTTINEIFRTNNTSANRPSNTTCGVISLMGDGSPAGGYLAVSVNGIGFIGAGSGATKKVTWNQIYSANNKPGKADVGLGNVTNDAQVKKAGDTMTGDLVVKKQNPAIGLNAVGTTNCAFRLNNESGSERGAIIALPNSASGGTLTIRAKNTAGAHTGELVVDSTGKISAVSTSFTGEMASKTAKVINTNDSDASGTTVWVKGAQHTPLLLERHTANGNLSIGFKLNTGTVYRLGVDVSGYLAFGTDANQGANSRVVTQRVLDEGVTVGGITTFTNRVNVNGGIQGAIIPNDINGETVDLNTLVINSGVDGVRYYHVRSEGGGANITNKPAGVRGNFLLRLDSMRNVAPTDYNTMQTLVTGDTSKMYVRVVSNHGAAAWKEVIFNDQNQNLTLNSLSATSTIEAKSNLRVAGSISIGGGNTGITADKAIVFSKGSTFRETATGGAVVSSAGGTTDRRLHLLPAGPSGASNNGVIISATAATGGDTVLEFQTGAKLRSNSAGAAILSSKSQSVFLRPNGDGNSAGQMTVATDGSVAINGNTSITGWLACEGSFTSKQAVNAPSIELSGTTPFIDFHFNKSSADYTSRIIERAAGLLAFDNTAIAVGRYIDCFGEIVAGRRLSNTNPPNGTLVNGQSFTSISVGRGGYTDTRGMKSMFYVEENVGNIHYAVIGLDGHGRQAYWTFRVDGGIKTPQGDVQMVGSDVRIKNSFAAPKEGARDRIMELGVCEFKMNGDDRVRRGFIAQQADMVDDVYAYQSAGGKTKDENGNDFEILNIDQTAIMADMVTTIQEQDAEIKSLKSELAELRAMVEKLVK